MSVTPDIHLERQRLLLAMRHAPDYHELAFSMSEHSRYLRGLRDSGMISPAAADVYALDAEKISVTACNRLAMQMQFAS